MNWRAWLPRGLRDARWRMLALTFTIITAGGAIIAAVADSGLLDSRVTGAPTGAQAIANDPIRQEIHQRFQQGVAMLHSKQYEHAITAFHRVLALDPAMPEAHVNMGFALIGAERYGVARDFFMSAIELRKHQLNAYYGLAVALDELNDRPGAIGAMRTFVHLSKPDDPHMRKAQSALWEWEAAREQQDAAKGRAPGR